jgi:hypothetical protein
MHQCATFRDRSPGVPVAILHKTFSKLDSMGRALTALLIAIALATSTTIRSLRIIA